MAWPWKTDNNDNIQPHVDCEMMTNIVLHYSVHVYVVIISKYATKIVGTQNRQVACVH